MEHWISCPSISKKYHGPCTCKERMRDAAREEAMSYMGPKERQALIDEAVENEIDRKTEAEHETTQD